MRASNRRSRATSSGPAPLRVSRAISSGMLSTVPPRSSPASGRPRVVAVSAGGSRLRTFSSAAEKAARPTGLVISTVRGSGRCPGAWVVTINGRWG
jgi:hypothetical protein